MGMNVEELDGTYLVGTFDRVEAICYGANHAKAGQEVKGLRRVIVTLDNGWEREASFFTEEKKRPTQVHEFVGDGEHLKGRKVVIAVRAKASGKYVNYDAEEIVAADAPALSAVAGKSA